jgi:hypothetical protein
MRYTTIVLGTLMLLAVSACKTTQRVNSREPVTASVEVPPPASTPFDGIADARAAYLQNYREGYSTGFPGFAAPPWMRVGEAYDLTDPRMRGWRDGVWAARLDAAAKLRKEE